MKTPTPTEIKYKYENGSSNRHFFERSTMKFFGDTMKSFGSRTIEGQVYLYRKPTAKVNVFGRWQGAGRKFFNAWRFNSDDGALNLCSDDETDKVWCFLAR